MSSSVSEVLSYALSFKGYNYSKMINAGMRKGNPTLWCADFVAFILGQKGVASSINSSSQQFIGMRGYNAKDKYLPKRGDVFVLSNTHGGGGHTGFVTGVSGTVDSYEFTTVEGNSGSKVNECRYSKNYNSEGQILAGFWTPNYSDVKKTENKKSLGTFIATAYCPCKICCGKYSPEVTGQPSKTASGTTPKANHTVAVDPDVISLGSKLLIDGKVYYAEDTGGLIKGKKIDIFFDTHQEALNAFGGKGKASVEVYLLEENTSSSNTSFNLDKKSIEALPNFNKAEKAKLIIDKNNKGLNLKIIHENVIYDVSQLCYDKVQLTTKRKATPAKLTFKIARDLVEAGGIVFNEGDAVAMMYDDVPMFWGYVFSKSRTKEQIIDVTAYDQTRYLKNKDTYCYTNTASGLIKTICNDYRLQIGTIADTGFTISERIEDNQSLFDIIFNSLDTTKIYTGKSFFFYDDFGDITLKAYDDLMLNLSLVSDYNTLIDFTYKTDIDTDSYNRILLYRDDKDTNTREVYSTQDSINIMKWGILQYSERISDGYTQGQISEMANRLLNIYNRVKKTFSVENSGVPGIRAGNGIWVSIKDTGDVINAGYIIESCVHTFENGRHTMKLELAERGD